VSRGSLPATREFGSNKAEEKEGIAKGLCSDLGRYLVLNRSNHEERTVHRIASGMPVASRSVSIQ